MKKVLSLLFVSSLLLVSCTATIPIPKDTSGNIPETITNTTSVDNSKIKEIYQRYDSPISSETPEVKKILDMNLLSKMR